MNIADTFGLSLAIPHSLQIGGVACASSDGGTFEVRNPASNELLAVVESASADDAARAVDAAQAALPGWSNTAPRQRSDVLRRAYELMYESRRELAALIVRENGKVMSDALSEVDYAAEFFRWYAEEAVRMQGSTQTAPHGRNEILVEHTAIGVALLVTPWNFPAAMATRKIGPALAAGCSVVLKPAAETPLTALAIGAILEQAGAPAGVVNIVPGDRASEIVSSALQHCAVRKLSFTGSTQVGKLLLAQAATQVISCSMELGGNAPFIVLEDVDVDEAVQGALVAKMRNGGEACTAANRFYVHDAVADEFSSKLARAMGALKVGAGLEADSQVGPLINARAVEKVHSLVEDARLSGGHVLTGGEALDSNGHFYAPTVIDRVPRDARILHTEIFGPVAPIVRYSDVQDAVSEANGSPYGLVSYVFGRDMREAMQVTRSLQSGMVGVNQGIVSDPAAPFGGTKQSGLGREGGHEGILEYTEMKYIAVRW